MWLSERRGSLLNSLVVATLKPFAAEGEDDIAALSDDVVAFADAGPCVFGGKGEKDREVVDHAWPVSDRLTGSEFGMARTV